jgi:hypothetical protein
MNTSASLRSVCVCARVLVRVHVCVCVDARQSQRGCTVA